MTVNDGQILNKTKTLGRSKDAGVKAGARYECIYKNLIRDLRQHFAAKFDNYLVSKVGKTNTFGKNNRSKYEIFPFLLLRFSIDTFDKELVEGINTEKSYPDFMKSFALTLGSFILPKFTIRSFGTQDAQESKNQQMITSKMFLPSSSKR